MRKYLWLLRVPGILVLGAVLAPMLRAQGGDEFDQYTLRLEGYWLNVHPSGSIHGTGTFDTQEIDLRKDFGLPNYSTVYGRLDWKFTHKNHLYLFGLPFDATRERALARTVTFENQTFTPGITARTELRNLLIGLGYQYDFIRRRRGHLGVAIQANILNTTAKISAQAQVVNGVTLASASASKTLFAPLPVLGFQGRIYPFHSPRFFIEGNVFGMYFFGYGNFLSSTGTAGIGLTRRLSINGGYAMGSRYTIRNTNNRLGIQFTETGPIVGIEFSL